MADPARDRRERSGLCGPDGIRLGGKQVLLVNRDQPLPTLAFLI
jgi:hypothetical protein